MSVKFVRSGSLNSIPNFTKVNGELSEMTVVLALAFSHAYGLEIR